MSVFCVGCAVLGDGLWPADPSFREILQSYALDRAATNMGPQNIFTKCEKIQNNPKVLTVYVRDKLIKTR
jgi:hypothetical protein